MNYFDAIAALAEIIEPLASTTAAYFWRLSGDEPNSLCCFLCIEEEEMKSLLRFCGIYFGEDDKFKSDKFDLTMVVLLPSLFALFERSIESTVPIVLTRGCC